MNIPRIDVAPERLSVFQGEGRRPVQHLHLQSPAGDASTSGGRYTNFRATLDGAAIARRGEPVSVVYDGETIGIAEPAAGSVKATGAIDVVDSFGVGGWVFDLDRRARAEASIRIGGEIVIPVFANEDRRDVQMAGAANAPDTGFSCRFAELDESIRGKLNTLFDGEEYAVALYLGDQKIAERRRQLGKNLLLHAELDGARVHGWIGAHAWPRRPVFLEFLIDGNIMETSQAVDLDPELMAERGLAWACSFSFTPICAAAPERDGAEIAIRAAGALGEPTAKFSVTLPRRLPRTSALTAARIALESSEVKPAIVVPIHNAPEALEACLSTISQHTPMPHRLILVDDASTDRRIGKLLSPYEEIGAATVLRNHENLGYTRSVNRGLAEAGAADAVLLNSDVRVTPRWLENLRLAAFASPDIGTVTAVSDNAGAFSVPVAGTCAKPEWLSDDEFARLVTQNSAMVWPGVPTGNGFCMYIKHACRNAVGPLDEDAFPRGYGEENDFCMRALGLGWRHVVDERTLVYHERSASFGAEKEALLASAKEIIRQRYPDFRARVSYFEGGQPMAAARARIATAIRSSRDAPRPPRPRVLFVISTTAGGTPLTNADLMHAVEDQYEPFLLRSDSRAITLHRIRDGEPELLETFHLPERIDPVNHRSVDYDSVLGDWMSAYAIELLHIRHIAWHSLGLPMVARSLAIPVVFSFHDFYPVCPTVKLLDENQIYCAGRCTAQSDRDCEPDLWLGLETPPLKDEWVHSWRANFARMLEHCDSFVTTSATAREVVVRHFPGLAERTFRLIPHGRDMQALREPSSAALAKGERLRVLVPGSISLAKGADLIRDIKAMDAGDLIEFHILGRPDPALEGVDAVHHGAYQREDFLAHVERIQPHIGAVLSRWPETYCHTLTELWSAGLPVLGLDIGAVGERLRQEGPGWLVPVEDRERVGADKVLAVLRQLVADPKRIAKKAKAVGRWQRDFGSRRTTAWMADQYVRLYRETTSDAPLAE